MAEKKSPQKKTPVNLQEYIKNKESREKEKLKLHLPLAVKVLIIIPLAYVLFLIAYFLINLRFLPEH